MLADRSSALNVVPAGPKVGMRELLLYFLRLGLMGFGGPVALVGQMEKELVGERKWLTRLQMREAVAVCQSLPGPLAIQVGIFIAYLRGGFWGAWAGGVAFILPNFVIVAAHGIAVGKEMGINTWAAFAGSDEAAFVDGDFAMHENELQPVLHAMRREGINIVAIHQHMSHEQPRYLFLHYWGKGKAVDLARSLKRVLGAQAAVKS